MQPDHPRVDCPAGAITERSVQHTKPLRDCQAPGASVWPDAEQPHEPEVSENKNYGRPVQPESTGPAALFTEDELTRLRELARAKQTRGWRDYGLLIAGAGFALSLATGVISAYVGYRKDVHDRQAQLAATIQTIQELGLKQAEVYEKYRGTAFESIAGMITAEINTAYRTASELARGLGSNATTAELITVAEGAYPMGDYATTESLLTAALSSAQNANDESIALRRLGFLKVRNGTSQQSRQEGEALFARAMSLDTKYNIKSLPYTEHFLRGVAAFDWANSVAPFDCAGAQIHFADGVAELLANPRTPEMDQMRRTARRAYSEGIGGRLTCKPTKQTDLPE